MLGTCKFFESIYDSFTKHIIMPMIKFMQACMQDSSIGHYQ
jgi:large-conductance mechanosensitive channel